MSLPSASVGSVTLAAFVRRDWAVDRSYRLPFAMSLVGSLVVLLVLYQAAKLVGTRAGGSSQLGHGYFSFAVVGTVAIQLVHTATQSFATKLREEQTTGTLEALLATPTAPSTVILGSGLYPLLRSLFQAIGVLLLAGLFGLRVQLGGPYLAVSALTLLGLLLLAAEAGVLVAAFTVVFKRGTTLSGLINAGLALLAGVWYPVSTLPQGVRALANAIPFTWGLTALRDALLFGRIDPSRVLGLLAVALPGLPAALWVFRTGVDRARLRGSLGQY